MQTVEIDNPIDLTLLPPIAQQELLNFYNALLAQYNEVRQTMNNEKQSPAWKLLLNKSAAGIRTKAEIDAQIKKERENWDIE